MRSGFTPFLLQQLLVSLCATDFSCMVPVILDVLKFRIFLDLDSLHDVYVFLSVSYDGKSIPYVLIPSAWIYCNTYCRTAYDVSINDDSWPTEAFELVTGEKSKTLERLDP